MLDPEHIPSFQVSFHSDTAARTGNSELRRLRQELKASLCYVVSFRIAYQNKNLNTPPKRLSSSSYFSFRGPFLSKSLGL